MPKQIVGKGKSVIIDFPLWIMFFDETQNSTSDSFLKAIAMQNLRSDINEYLVLCYINIH